jgi:glycosyltransferase involved in cell wall biosynthesis
VKIAYILFKYPKESETFVREEIVEVMKKHPVTIFSINNSDEQNRLDVDVVYPKKSYNILKTIKWFFYLLFRSWRDIKYIPVSLYFSSNVKNNFSHIHTWFAASTATISYIISKETGIPFSFSAHSRDIFVRREGKNLMKDKIRNAKFVLVPSEWHKKYMTENYGYKEKYFIIPNSIRTDKFKPGKIKKENKIVFIGRDMEKKGLKYLKQAIELLGNRYRLVHIDGGVTDEQLIKELSSSRVFVMPSIIASDNDSDGIPTAVMEAMACGIPIVSTNIRALPEAVEGCGIIIEPKNPEQITDAVKKLMANKTLSKKYGKNGIKRAKEKFDVVKNSRKLIELFEMG